MVHITPEAAAQLRHMYAVATHGDLAVRIGLQRGGCAGLKYVIDPITRRSADDVVFEQDGVTVVCDPITLASVAGMRVDYVEAMVGGGFRFENPNAGRACGCGASFAPAE